MGLEYGIATASGTNSIALAISDLNFSSTSLSDDETCIYCAFGKPQLMFGILVVSYRIQWPASHFRLTHHPEIVQTYQCGFTPALFSLTRQ